MTTRDLGFVALFAALIVALGLVPAVPLAGLPVPITLQSAGVMLAGLLLGPKRGTAAVAVVIALVGLGFPVLSGGRGGLAVWVGPTAGFLFGWLAAAFVAGTVAMRLDTEAHAPGVRLAGLIGGAILGGIVVLYAFGIAWLTFGAGFAFPKAFVGSMTFLPGDIAKALIAAFVTAQVRRAFRLERK